MESMPTPEQVDADESKLAPHADRKRVALAAYNESTLAFATAGVRDEIRRELERNIDAYFDVLRAAQTACLRAKQV